MDVVDLDVEHGLGAAIHAGAHTSADAFTLLFHAHQPVREVGGRLGDIPIEQIAVILLEGLVVLPKNLKVYYRIWQFLLLPKLRFKLRTARYLRRYVGRLLWGFA